MLRTKGLLLLATVSLSTLLLQGCEGIASDDPWLYLTGTEEQPLMGGPTGTTPTCPSPKVLVCHIPPGNPANAHTICVGQPAVKAHVSHHGDGLGACGPSATTDAGTPPPPPPPPPPAPDAGPICVAINGSCATSADCCDAMICVAGENICMPQID